MIIGVIVERELKRNGQPRYAWSTVLRPVIGGLLNGCFVRAFAPAKWTNDKCHLDHPEELYCTIPGYGHNNQCYRSVSHSKERVLKHRCELTDYGVERYFGFDLDILVRSATDPTGDYRLPNGYLHVWHSGAYDGQLVDKAPHFNGNMFTPLRATRLTCAGPCPKAVMLPEVAKLLRRRGKLPRDTSDMMIERAKPKPTKPTVTSIKCPKCGALVGVGV